MKRNLETKKEREGRRENKSCCNKSLESWIRGHGEHILQRSQPKTQHIPPSYCVCVCVYQKHLAGMNGRGPCALTAVLGSTSLFFFSHDMASKGSCCNSNITAIRFEGLNCQARMMATTGHEL